MTKYKFRKLSNTVSSEDWSKMIGGKNFILTLALLSGLAGKINGNLPACPICTYTFEQTYIEGSIWNIENGGPPFGCTCEEGIVFTLFGRDFGLTQDGACCDISPPPRTPNNNEECPPIPRILIQETVGENFIRVGQLLDGIAPTNGNCPDPNTYKFIYYSDYTGASQDICTCVTPNNYVQKDECCFSH